MKTSLTAIRVMSVLGTIATFMETGIKVFHGEFLRALCWGVCTICWLIIMFNNFMEGEE